uniref:Neurexophilin and PC-esterase domain family, member 3 n=1 Tax=Hippocampus comes TaxID=109280 RepID=A0A3Q3D5G1_HIPCM
GLECEILLMQFRLVAMAPVDPPHPAPQPFILPRACAVCFPSCSIDFTGQQQILIRGGFMVQVQLRDFKGQPKRYGGDFLLARLHSPKYRAGVAGQVLDHENGLYSVRFPLLWQGSAQFNVMMVHSSEAATVLRRLREKRPDRVFFASIFRHGRHSEKTLCNMCLPPDKGPLCNYTDLHYGEQWYCYKPKGLGCDTRYNHFIEGYAENLITKKEALLFQRFAHRILRRAVSFEENGRLFGAPFSAENTFNKASAITQCLTNKLVYMYGDSTLRQWFKYLLTVLPGLKNIPLEKVQKPGPFMAVDVTHNILLNYRFHGLPLRIMPVMINELRYIANELDGLTGGPNTVVTLGIWAHFSTFPVEVYIQRIRHIRKAVVRLLDRSPEIVVVVRTANPQALNEVESLFKSDWVTLQQDIVLRAMFKGINVMWVDAWQMCLAHLTLIVMRRRSFTVRHRINIPKCKYFLI